MNPTPFVAFVILPRAIPNNRSDTLIIDIPIEPTTIVFSDLLIILHVKIFNLTIPIIRTEPNSAGTPVTATVARNKDDTAIRPVNAVNISAEPIALPICLLFFDSFLAIGSVLSTIFDKSLAPNIAGPPVIAAIVKNIDVNNKFPTRAVIFFATFVPSLIFFLFSVNFFDKVNNLFIEESIFLIPLFAFFENNDAKNNLNIDFANDDDSSETDFEILFAFSNIFLFFTNNTDIDNIEFFSPINISLNFLIVLFLIILLIFQPILFNAFIISGAAPTSLITLSRSFFFTFKSFSTSLNIFVNIFIFCFPRIKSFNEISFSFLNESIIADNLPPLFCLSMLFIIACATLSDALLLNFATAGIDVPLCFVIAFDRLSIDFLIPFVSSRIS